MLNDKKKFNFIIMIYHLLLLIIPISSIKNQGSTITCNISIQEIVCDNNICECNGNITYENVAHLIIAGKQTQNFYKAHLITINNSKIEITLQNIYIELTRSFVSPFVANHSDIDFKFEGGNNILQSSSHDAGIECANGSSLTFTYSKSFKDDYLYVEGNIKGAGIGTGEYSGHCKNLIFNDGNITGLTYGEAAGIGTGNNHKTLEARISRIVINGGNILARGPRGTYYYGSGLGVGMSGTVENIIINGGNITARGNYGSGIGGGFGGHIGNVTINGGYITSYSYGTSGIGSGYHYDVMDSIIINNGTINSTAYFGAAIGGGAQSNVKNIIINDGSIFASVDGISFSYSSGIGAGQNGTCEHLQINGGNITAIGFYGAGIGASNSANCSVINITGGNINAIGTKGAGIGAGAGFLRYKGGVDLISISGGNITAIGNDSAGIGGGYSRGLHGSNVGLIEISGNLTYVNATGINGAGIGASLTDRRFGSHVDGIKINGGNIYAKGTTGIGGSSKEHLDTGNVYTIEITGGQIEAVGLYTGIGAGTATKLNKLSISGGKITAKSTVNGAGIGGGGKSQIDLISITGGEINAFAEGQGGAGIGIGTSIQSQQNIENKAIINTIEISNSKIFAKGKNYGAGIGGGETIGLNSSYIDQIIIKEGSFIEALGGDYGAGIGGGYESFVGTLSLQLKDNISSQILGVAGHFASDGIGNGYLGKADKINNNNGNLVCSTNNIVCIFSDQDNPELPPEPTKLPEPTKMPEPTEKIETPSQSENQFTQTPDMTKSTSQSTQTVTITNIILPTQSPTDTSDDKTEYKPPLTPAMIAGIAIGSTVVVAGLVVGGIFLVKKYFGNSGYAKQDDVSINEDERNQI